MPSPTLLAILFLFLPALPALTTDSDREQMLELEQVRQRVRKMNGLQEIFDEIPREGARAVVTLGIFPLLSRTENTERFLERHPGAASAFGPFARTVVNTADLYLGYAELAPLPRKVLESGVEKFEMWLGNMSQRGLIAYEANEQPPTYVERGLDPFTDDLRSVVALTFDKFEESPSDAIAGGEMLALVTAPTRLLAVLSFVPADAEPSTVDNLIRSMRYVAAVFRLFFRQPNRMHFGDVDRNLVVEYIERTFQDTMKAENWQPVADALERLREWKQTKDRHDL